MSFSGEWLRPGPIQDYKLYLVVLCIPALLIQHIAPPTVFYDTDS